MRYLKTVYRYRYDEKEHIWHKCQLFNVLASGTMNNYNLSDELNRDAYIVLRIMGEDNADIKVQDVIAFCDGKTPPKEKAVVISVTKNSQGSKRVRHTKVVCK